MKRIHYNYLYPPFYFSRLFFFFIGLSVLLTLQLIFLTSFTSSDFLTLVIVLLFLLLSIGVLVEYSKKGEYMSPLEKYDVMGFVQELLESKRNREKLNDFFLRYTQKPKKSYEKLTSRNTYYMISTISKQGQYYEVTLLDQAQILRYFFIKFLSKKATLHLRISKIDGELKVISLQ